MKFSKIKTKVNWWVLIVLVLLVGWYFYTRTYSYGEDAYTLGHSSTRFTGLDYVVYYAYLWRTQFATYPVVVRICYGVVVGSAFLMVFFMCKMADEGVRARNRQKALKKILTKYYDKLLEVCSTEQALTTEQISDIMDYEPKKWSQLELRLWMRVFIRVRCELAERVVEKNFQQAMKLIGIAEFIDYKLSYSNSNNKTYYLQALLPLNAKVAESTYLRMTMSPNFLQRRSAREAYALLTDDDCMHFWLEDKRDYLTLWERMLVNWTFYKRSQWGRSIPSLVPILRNTPNDAIKSSLLMGIGYFGSENDKEVLLSYINDQNQAMRLSAVQGIRIGKYLKGEEAMKETFYQQTDKVQCAIINAILYINSGRSAQFLKEAYQRCITRQTRRTALYALWNYGAEGKSIFNALKTVCDNDDKRMFEHIENKIISGGIELDNATNPYLIYNKL